MYESGNNVVYFDSFGVEKETKILQKGIYRTQACDSIMWGYSCNKFIDFTLNNRKLVGFSSILSKKN